MVDYGVKSVFYRTDLSIVFFKTYFKQLNKEKKSTN